METTPKKSAPLTVTYPGAAYWAFGDSAQMADELGALVVGGIKTATCCSLQAYQQDASSPRIGDYSVILDGRERPLAVIRTTALRLLRFCDVTAEMAAKEGEGDLSLAYWRETHRAFFERAGHWSEEMALVVEEFMLVETL
ncbi:ASCH domain-containing protein [Sodalis sp.]|uniref:ASCH domain-containing protein n=1 Tax=Sodalis sp. (in: enterobacteria) TaxID=1898979 RepID=UPI0038730492